MPTPPAPLFRDPIHDGAADPVVIWNRAEREWWLIYTNRRTDAPGIGVSWVHGTDLGVASSRDGGHTWAYRGILSGLDIEWGRNTFWAPEIIWHDGTYHMYVSYIRGVPSTWEGHPRHILHYTSRNLRSWTFRSQVELSSDRVIDACVHPLPTGGFRMWFKDEAHGSHTYAADSPDLYNWTVTGPVLTERPHEGPNVFAFADSYWLIVDEWRGQGVFASTDLQTWQRGGLILDRSGKRPDDTGVGLHADVVVDRDRAFVFYFTHPERTGKAEQPTQALRRSSVQVAELVLRDGVLTCDRDAEPPSLLDPEGPAGQ